MVVRAATGYTADQYIRHAEHYGPDFVAETFAREHPDDEAGLVQIVRALLRLTGTEKWIERKWAFVLTGGVREGASRHAGNKDGIDRRLIDRALLDKLQRGE